MSTRPFHKSNKRPHVEQIKEVSKWGDDSFCVACSPRFESLGVPCVPFEEVTYNPEQRGILLSLKNVHPHDDPWVGNYEIEPKERLAIFWVLKCGSPIWFGVVGHEPRQMSSGDYVVFDDSQTHFVIADKKWHGVAWQLLSAP